MFVLEILKVRRGSERAEIYSLAFSSDAKWLAVSSDKGTVHVFSLKIGLALMGNDTSDGASKPNHANSSRASSFSMLKGIFFPICLFIVHYSDQAEKYELVLTMT